MTLLKAIADADVLRPNDIPGELKAAWLFPLEAEFAEERGVEITENTYPEDVELIVEYPYDQCYPLYLAAMIDNANQETTLYANDSAVATAAIDAAKSHYIRTHKPTETKVWRTGL